VLLTTAAAVDVPTQKGDALLGQVHSLRRRALLAMVAAMSVVTMGCGATGSDTATPVKTTRAQHDTSVADKHVGKASGPSAPAQMICGSEIRQAVKLMFGLLQMPSATHTWSNQIFTCNYALRGGALVLSVEDSSDLKAGDAYFARLRARLPGAQLIDGPENFGFPALQTADGNVAFLKDGKTLRVDASGLPDASLPLGASHQATAYAIAAAVVGCWTE
jgi:hypothetical protein